MRELIGRLLCFALGALYTAGAVPLFTFGPAGKQIWDVFENSVAALATTISVSPWLATTLVGFFAIGGPLALVWLIAGKGVSRLMWMLAGVLGYGVFWLVA